MITSAQIARFRGIRDLVVDGLGRVNLVIGKNDCGKSALLEALQIADSERNAAHYLHASQRRRLRHDVTHNNFDRFWRPLFFNLDAKLGLTIGVIIDRQNTWRVLEVHQGPVPEEIISDVEGPDDLVEAELPIGRTSWSLELQLRTENEQSKQRIIAAGNRVRLPPPGGELGSGWATPGASVGPAEVRFVSELKRSGRDGELLELLRHIDGRLSGIEILAPSGSTAELFVRLDEGTPLLPVALMGDGFQRCLEIGGCAAAHNWPTMFIDEVENGLHHLALEPLWRWLAIISRQRNLQVFATTHSEECIHAACRAFGGLEDEGLRVIRLDRLESGTRAVTYDRTLLETAVRTDTEIRG